MALISNFNLTCAGCKQPFPARDDVCPKCGHATPAGARRNKLRKGCLIGCPAIFLVLVVLLAIVGSFLPPPGDQERSATEQPPAKVAAARPVPQRPPDSPLVDVMSPDELRFLTAARQLSVLQASCGTGHPTIMNMLRRNDAVAAYRQATRAIENCDSAMNEMREPYRLSLPDDRSRQAFTVAESECRGALPVYRRAYVILRDAIDQGGGVAELAQVEDLMSDARAATVSCKSSLHRLAGDIGIADNEADFLLTRN